MPVGVLRTLWRAPRLGGHLVLGALLIPLLRSAGGPCWYQGERGQRVIRWWMVRLNRVLGVRMAITGTPCAGPVLLVANHVSWLDIPVVAALSPAAFVAKANVRAWPLIGWLAASVGTLFLRRGSLAALRGVLGDLEPQLRAGRRVMVFPEGTTTTGEGVREFFAGLFQAAVASGSPVQTVTIAYRRAGVRDHLAPFVGDDSFLPHLLRLLAASPLDVQVHYGSPISSAGHSPKTLAGLTRARIGAVLAAVTAGDPAPAQSLSPAATPCREVRG